MKARSQETVPPPFPSSLRPWQTLICFLSLWTCFLRTFHVNGIILYTAFCVWHDSIVCFLQSWQSTSFLPSRWNSRFDFLYELVFPLIPDYLIQNLKSCWQVSNLGSAKNDCSRLQSRGLQAPPVLLHLGSVLRPLKCFSAASCRKPSYNYTEQ